MTLSSLSDIFQDDDLNILTIPPTPAPVTPDERLVDSFHEITKFVEDRGKSPKLNPSNLAESTLYWRLEAIQKDPVKLELLAQHDTCNILTPSSTPNSVDDILDDDSLGLLKDDTNISTISHVPHKIDVADYIARQKPCGDFSEFEHKFFQCHQDLESGKRELKQFAQEQQIDKGEYFILKGVMVYVDKVGKKSKDKNGKTNARLRVIYENGTESNLLLRSLARELYRGGRRVTEHEDRLLAGFERIDKEDQQDGYIYILSSLSDNPEIQSIKNLHKIGFSTMPVEKRIERASSDPTYLMAPVHIVQTYRCYNLSSQKFESLLHKFFSKARLDLQMTDGMREQYSPDEWFVVPFPVIDQAIQLIINGEIVDYRYDYKTENIVEK
jgi:hypothetical protein